MNDFPSTSQTLLEKLAAEATGEVGAAWTRFFSLYTPVMKRFVQMVRSVLFRSCMQSLRINIALKFSTKPTDRLMLICRKSRF